MQLIERRIGLLFACFLLFFVVALARSIWIQGIKGGQYSAEAASQQRETIVVPGSRGSILDRNGIELAISEDAATVVATPYLVTDPVKAADKLAALLDTPEEKLLELLSDEDSGFAYLERKVDLSTAEEVRKLALEGIYSLPDSRRIYPEGKLAGQLIGATGIENDGLTGLEAAHDELLHGTDGEREVIQDASGAEIERTTLDVATVGEDLTLTIDTSIQAQTEAVLADIGTMYQPQGATAIVMDPQTSEVLAMANWPPLDPQKIEDADPSQLLNLATGFTYEPGSTFKAFTVAAAMEERLVTPETTFTLGETITVADRVISESHSPAGGTLSVADILAQSSNVGAVTIGLEVGGERFDHWIRTFGFGSPTGIDFPGEEMGIVLEPEDYSGSTMGNLPIGQGISVTPMQMVAGYAAIANGGVLRPPRLVLENGDEAVPAPEGKRIMSEETAADLREMLEGVLEAGGTASAVEVPGYVLAGKTGTAEKAIDGGYSDTDFVASFVGMAPAEDPQLLVTIVVDTPRGSYYGGVVAAPAFGQIAEFALPYLGVAPSE